ncbi:putative periplasmic binding protein-like I [Helianthus annuus]|nr:putative periplasmic binding protein-like I [Helianthus annuus]KAJ0697482.1 putative periplasmic binding protein-like I [Helianthus annuus]
MHNLYSCMILSLVAFSLTCFLPLQATLAAKILTTAPKAGNETGVGVILDQTSRPGKEAKVAIELAVQDFNIKIDQPLVLYLKNSRNKHVQAVAAAKELVDEHKVKVILGGHTWEEASTIAEVISDSEPDHDIPVFLSFAGTIPLQSTNQWPFLIHAVPTQSTQMNAVAAILESMGIRQVTLIYESASIISHLTQAFRETGSELTHSIPITSRSCSLDEELEVVKRQQRKVFVVHTSLEVGVCLFQTAKKMEMIGDGYLWIATNAITDLFHSVNSSVFSSLKGMVGVKSYFPESTPEFLNFRKRFRKKFHSDYPEDEQDEPGIFAVQGYNAMKMLEKALPEKLNELKTVLANTVEIVNVNGKGYHSVYWTEGLGFSETVENEINGASNYTHLIDNVGEILWPVQPWYASRSSRRNLAGSSQKRMKVLFPAHSLFRQFVSVDCDPVKNEYVFGGFVYDVFDAMMKIMDEPYDRIPFNDSSYENLIKAIDSGEFDAVAGDVTITSKRHEHAHFTQPFTESGLEMIVPARSRLSNQAWLFLKPFTAKMWWITVAITLYNGFVIWFIERNHNKDLQGNIITQIGIILWLAFSTLFTLRGDKMHSNLSRMAVIVWLFVALIITQSYTASLASMLTAQRLEPTITSFEMLRDMNAAIGYCNGSFINEYLVNVLKFKNFSIKSYNSTDGYAEGLNSGEIKAIFLEVPAAKVFLAQYCKSFIRTGETFKVGGFGFAFHKKFERLSAANEALMNVSESGLLKELEDKHLISEKCVDEESSPDEKGRLSLHSFWVLFVLTVGTSTVALVIYIVTGIKEFKKSNQEDTNLVKLISAFIKDWQLRVRRSSSIVASVESARGTIEMSIN